MSTETIEIAIWSDGTWCYLNKLSEYTWMSDDYITQEISNDMEPETIEEYVCSFCDITYTPTYIRS